MNNDPKNWSNDQTVESFRNRLEAFDKEELISQILDGMTGNDLKNYRQQMAEIHADDLLVNN